MFITQQNTQLLGKYSASSAKLATLLCSPRGEWNTQKNDGFLASHTD